MGRIGLGLITITLLLFLASCQSEDQTLGSSFVNSNTSIVYVDTFSVSTSTFVHDTIKTSNKSAVLVGKFEDKKNIVGKINSQSYIILRNQVSTLSEYALYDSIVLLLKPSGYYYGDTTSAYTIQVNRVTQDILFNKNDTYLYNNSHFNFEPTPLGEYTFKPKPNKKQLLRLKLEDELGLDFINKLKSSTNAFEEQGGFYNYFKGIVLRCSNGGSILGYNLDSTRISLYYHYEGSDNVYNVNFIPTLPSRQFNEITSDRSGTIIENISKTPIPSSKLNNYAIVQAGIGLVTRIDFPTVKNLREQTRSFEVIKAELVIQPSTLMEINYLPSSLNLYLTNKFNDLIGYFTDEDGTSIQDGSLYIDYIYRDNISYTWEITSFIKNQIKTNTPYNGLLLLPENYDYSFDHVIINDQKLSNYRTYLKLYLLYYD